MLLFFIAAFRMMVKTQAFCPNPKMLSHFAILRFVATRLLTPFAYANNRFFDGCSSSQKISA